MGSNSLIEMYAGLFGWLLNNRLWDILNNIGIAFVPFILLLIRALRDHRQQGDAVSVRQLVAILRVESLLAMLVLTLFVIPTVPVAIENVSATRVQVECGAPANTITANNDHSTYATSEAFAVLGGSAVYIPVGWAVWQAVANGITSAAVASIPCSGDLRGFQMQMASQSISDPQVRRELSDFTRDCYAAAVALIQRDNSRNGLYPPHLTAADTNWMGAQALLDHPLYAQRVSSPRSDFAYDPALDDGYGSQGGGHPTCAEWWSGARGNAGLRSRLIAQVDPSVMAKAMDAGAGGIRRYFGGGASNAEIEDDLLHSMISVSDTQPLEEGGALNNDYASNSDHSSSGSPGILTSIALTFGGAAQSVSHFPKMMMIREALPIAKAMLITALISLLPLIMVLSGYNVAALATAAVAFLGISIFDFIWAIAYWMDNMLVKTLESDVGGFLGWLAHPQTTLAMDFVTSVLCVVLPLFWLGMLGWIGVKTFTFVERAAIGLAAPAGAAGAAGGGQIAGLVTKGVRKRM